MLGAGITGLLAAAAASDFYEDVLVIERDTSVGGELDDGDARVLDRSGVPQYNQTHLMLAGGLAAIEDLVPGFTGDLVTLGARCADFGEAAALSAGPVRVANGSFDLPIVSGSRDMHERVLRSRVIGSGSVRLRAGVIARELLFDPGDQRVVGVRVSSPYANDEEELPADLLIDASGRGTRTHLDLAAHGYAPPREEVQRIDLRTTARRFRLRDTADPRHQRLIAIVQAGAAGGHRAGTALHVREREWAVGLSDYGRTHPPRDLAGFRAYARALPRPEIADLLDALEPLDAGSYFRTTANVRRYYEAMDRMPHGLVVLGDALASYDPGFGQGMTVAARQGRTLRTCLQEHSRDTGPRPLAQVFQPRAATDLKEAWDNVTRRHREITGTPPGRVPAAIGRYIESLLTAAADDPGLSATFLRFAHLTRPVSSLFTPAVVWRVARSRAARLRSAAAPTTERGKA